MKRKQKQALYNLVAVVTVVLAVIGVRLCAHYVAYDASVPTDSIHVNQGRIQEDTTTSAPDSVVSESAEMSKGKKGQGKRDRTRAKKDKKERSRPLERSFLDEEIPTE